MMGRRLAPSDVTLRRSAGRGGAAAARDVRLAARCASGAAAMTTDVSGHLDRVQGHRPRPAGYGAAPAGLPVERLRWPPEQQTYEGRGLLGRLRRAVVAGASPSRQRGVDLVLDTHYEQALAVRAYRCGAAHAAAC